MKWFKKIVMAATMALALTSPALTSPAQATSYYEPCHVCYYRVYYRDNCHCQWRCYGVYTNAYQAQRVANWIHNQGYDAFVR